MVLKPNIQPHFFSSYFVALNMEKNEAALLSQLFIRHQEIKG